MRFYRTDDGRWFATQAEARAAARPLNSRFSTIDVPTDKPGLLTWLGDQGGPSYPVNEDIANKVGEPALEAEQAHADELAIAPAGATAPLSSTNRIAPIGATAALSSANRSVALDEAFLAASLGQQLTLAAIALENARSLLPGTRAPEIAS